MLYGVVQKENPIIFQVWIKHFLAFTHLRCPAPWSLNENVMWNNGSTLKTVKHYKNLSRINLKIREAVRYDQLRGLLLHKSRWDA